MQRSPPRRACTRGCKFHARKNFRRGLYSTRGRRSPAPHGLVILARLAESGTPVYSSGGLTTMARQPGNTASRGALGRAFCFLGFSPAVFKVIPQVPRLTEAVPVYCGQQQEGMTVAKPNYKYDKRQRDLAKQKKKEEKLAKKQAKKAAETAASEIGTPTIPGDELVPH